MGRKGGVWKLIMKDGCCLGLQELNKLVMQKRPTYMCAGDITNKIWVCNGLPMLKRLNLRLFRSQPVADTSFVTPLLEARLLSALFVVGGKRAVSREKVRSAGVVFGGVSPLVPAGPCSEDS